MSRLLLSVVWGTFCVAYSQNAGAPANTVLMGTSLPLKCDPAANNVFMKYTGSGASRTGEMFECCAVNLWCSLGAGGGSGANSGSFFVVRTSNTVLTLGPGCAVSTPCNFYLANQEYSLTASATATISSGTDTAYIYLSSAGALTVGTASQSVTCSGCTAVTGITAFPPGSLPLWTWASTSGVWATTGINRIRIIGRSSPIETYGVTFTNSGNDIVAGVVGYARNVVSNCTMIAYTIVTNIPATISFDVWKKASSTSLPTVADTIIPGSAYIGTGSNARSHGEPINSSTFTTLSAARNDTFAFKLQSLATAGVTSARMEIECQ